jgi:hypothetical protein
VDHHNRWSTATDGRRTKTSLTERSLVLAYASSAYATSGQASETRT